MKTKNRIWFCPLIVIGCVLIFTNSCKKDEANNNSGIIFNPNLTYGTITDIDGNMYKTIQIGTQTWMAENLKTTHYRNGDLIGTTTPATSDISGEITPKYQWAYNGNESNVATYGRLYTWYAVTDSRNVCPTGWHVPTDAEWHTLVLTVDAEALVVIGDESSKAGGKLKEVGTTHWASPNTGADNSNGFTAIPSGDRYPYGSFRNLGNYSIWWSSTEGDIANAWYRSTSYDYSVVIRSYCMESFGSSVCCVKD
jgi:uncharacterized protein (TIGR02145 family)